MIQKRIVDQMEENTVKSMLGMLTYSSMISLEISRPCERPVKTRYDEKQ